MDAYLSMHITDSVLRNRRDDSTPRALLSDNQSGIQRVKFMLT